MTLHPKSRLLNVDMVATTNMDVAMTSSSAAQTCKIWSQGQVNQEVSCEERGGEVAVRDVQEAYVYDTYTLPKLM